MQHSRGIAVAKFHKTKFSCNSGSYGIKTLLFVIWDNRFCRLRLHKFFIVRLRSFVMRNMSGCSPLARVLLLKQITEIAASIAFWLFTQACVNQRKNGNESLERANRQQKKKPLLYSRGFGENVLSG